MPKAELPLHNKSGIACVVNWFAFPTLLLGGVFWAIGLWWAKRARAAIAGWVIASILALPAFCYVAYYSGQLGEPIWLYNLRSLPGSELLAAPAGLLAAWLQVKVVPRLKLSSVGRRMVVPGVLAFGLALPYLKPVMRPLSTADLKVVWEEDVCLQSSPSTCGPASAATILRCLGREVAESDLARESFSSGRGTENWYLARALRRRGIDVHFRKGGLTTAPFPVIAGVKLLPYESGHFIAVLGRAGEKYVVGDPLRGKLILTMKDLEERYRFTGFLMELRAEH